MARSVAAPDAETVVTAEDGGTHETQAPEVVMNSQQMVKPALIAGAIAVALVIGGMPGAYLGFLVLILGCALMMFFMMRAMGGMGRGGERTQDDVQDHDQASHGRPDGR